MTTGKISYKTIWKFELKITDHQSISMPVGAQILSVQTQKNLVTHEDKICLWAVVESQAPKGFKEFHIFGTGHIMTPGLSLRYIGTVQTHDGSLVWHVFTPH